MFRTFKPSSSDESEPRRSPPPSAGRVPQFYIRSIPHSTGTKTIHQSPPPLTSGVLSDKCEVNDNVDDDASICLQPHCPVTHPVLKLNSVGRPGLMLITRVAMLSKCKNGPTDIIFPHGWLHTIFWENHPLRRFEDLEDKRRRHRESYQGNFRRVI